MLQEHSKNLRKEIEVFKKSMAEDVVINENKVVLKGGPETRDAIIQLIAYNANITSREMANKLNINRNAILIYTINAVI